MKNEIDADASFVLKFLHHRLLVPRRVYWENINTCCFHLCSMLFKHLLQDAVLVKTVFIQRDHSCVHNDYS